jgi:DNA-3-methyladenine glycosylase II
VHHVFPSPVVLADLPRFTGLSDEKVARLRGVGQAALSGLLDAERLRALGETRALSELPTAEPRVLHGLASAYRLEAPSEQVFRRIASGWRPFRMWVCVLLMRHLARSGGWHARELPRERAAAGRQLLRRAPKPAA